MSPGNSVSVVERDSGAFVASGSIHDSAGVYFVEISKDWDFNGTTLTMQITIDGRTYQLTEDGSTPVEFAFIGGFPFPARTTKNLSVISVPGGTSGGGMGKAGSTISGAGDCTAASSFDATGDGVSNQSDIDYIKSQLVVHTPDAAADINKDGRVTTADVVAAIRGMASGTRGRAACPPKAPPPTHK